MRNGKDINQNFKKLICMNHNWYDSHISTKLNICYHFFLHILDQWENKMFVTFNRGFVKGRALGKLTGCEWDLAINLPGCFRLIFLLSFIRKTKNVRLKKPTDLPYSNLVKPLIQTGLFYSNTSVNELHFWADDFLMNLKTWVSGEVSQVGKIWELLFPRANWKSISF